MMNDIDKQKILQQAKLIIQQKFQQGEKVTQGLYKNKDQIKNNIYEQGAIALKKSQKKFEQNPLFKKKVFKARVLQFGVLLIPSIFILYTSIQQNHYSQEFKKKMDQEIEKYDRNSEIEILEDDIKKIQDFSAFLFITIVVFNIYMYLFGCYKTYNQNSQQIDKFIQKKVNKNKYGIKEIQNKNNQDKNDTEKNLKQKNVGNKNQKDENQQEEKDKQDKKKDNKFLVGFTLCVIIILYSFIGQFIASLIFLTTKYKFEDKFQGITDSTDFQELKNITEFIVWQPAYIIPVQAGFFYFLGKYIYKQYDQSKQEQQKKLLDFIFSYNIQQQ